MDDPAPELRRDRRLTPEFAATLLLLLAYIVWLISLPAWPSQDGPAHLYYAHVMGALLSHEPGVYAHYYTIKHLLPPYALYYYALLALSHVFSLLVADKLVVCAYLLLFTFGVRYLARAVGPNADRTTLLALLLGLSWSVGMGFVNFCLSLAVVFWAVGLWLRFADNRLWRRAVFLLLVVAITLTHPVPLLVLIGFCVLDLFLRAVLRHGLGKANPPASLADLITLAFACLALAYVRHFATSHPLEQAQPTAASFVTLTAGHVRAMLELHNLMLIFGHTAPITIYRVGLLLTPLVGFALAIRQWLAAGESRARTSCTTWIVLAIALAIAVPLLPSNISNAYFFSERMTVLVWLAPLLAVAACGRADGEARATRSQTSGLIRICVLMFAVITNLSLLWAANGILRPIAHEVTSISTDPARTGKLGMVLEDARKPQSLRSGPAWNPFEWAAIHDIRKNDAILDNAPWLDSALIPLGATSGLPGATLSTDDAVSPHHLSMTLQNSASARAQQITPVDFVLIEQPGLPAPSTLDAALASAGDDKHWNCVIAPGAWYQVCDSSGAK